MDSILWRHGRRDNVKHGFDEIQEQDDEENFIPMSNCRNIMGKQFQIYRRMIGTPSLRATRVNFSIAEAMILTFWVPCSQSDDRRTFNALRFTFNYTVSSAMSNSIYINMVKTRSMGKQV